MRNCRRGWGLIGEGAVNQQAAPGEIDCVLAATYAGIMPAALRFCCFCGASIMWRRRVACSGCERRPKNRHCRCGEYADWTNGMLGRNLGCSAWYSASEACSTLVRNHCGAY
jgi:hypothetical protein